MVVFSLSTWNSKKRHPKEGFSRINTGSGCGDAFPNLWRLSSLKRVAFIHRHLCRGSGWTLWSNGYVFNWGIHIISEMVNTSPKTVSTKSKKADMCVCVCSQSFRWGTLYAKHMVSTHPRGDAVHQRVVQLTLTPSGWFSPRCCLAQLYLHGRLPALIYLTDHQIATLGTGVCLGPLLGSWTTPRVPWKPCVQSMVHI